jgi:hypothetical protein
MSAKYTFLAWETPVKDASTKLALLQLANNADDNGFSYYSISKMAIACDMSERNFMRKIKNLEKLNVLTVERRSNRPSLYTLVGDEMGVTICHLQESGVTTCHAEVTGCHLVGDNLSHDPNTAPNTTPINVDLAKEEKADRINWIKIRKVFNESFAERISNEGKLLEEIECSVMTPKRKDLLIKLMKDADIDQDKLINYIEYAGTSKVFEFFRVDSRKLGGKYSHRPFDWYFSIESFVKAKES